MKHYDLAIIGGGMAGAAFASALQHTDLQILLIDAAPLHTGIDHRLIALTDNSCNIFKNLGLWPTLLPHAAAIKEIHVSKRGQFGASRITARDAGLATLGHLIPAQAINAALAERLTKLKNLTQLRPAKLTALTQQINEVTLTIEHDHQVESCTAKIVIGADGTHSTVRRLMDIATENVDYQQKALVTQLELQRDHQHIAYERFLATGAIAMLPLSEKKVAVIWSDTNETIEGLLKLSDDLFLQTVQQHFGFRLGKFIKAHARAWYPLQFVKAKEQSRDRVLLIGNAAHTLHPIASQGLNLTLHEIAVLAEKLTAQKTLVMPDIDDYLSQQKISINLSHQLTQLFSADFFGISAARQLGLIGLDAFAFAKKAFIKRALGKAGHIPQLCKSE